MTSKPESLADERLIASHDLALAALHEITPADTVGPAAGHLVEDGGAVSLRFHTRLAGYPGWFWTVSVAVVDDSEPTVLEVELLPGDGALLAPEWVPWATRLAEYQAAQAAAHSDEIDDDELDDGDDEGDDDLDGDGDADADEDDDAPKARFHAGDLDGVDIDELDDDATAAARDAHTAAGDDDESDDDDDAPYDEEDDVHGGEDRSY